MTTLERTVLDLAARLDARQIEHALVAGDRNGRLRWEELWRLVTEHGRGRRGVRRLKRVMLRVDPRFADAVSPLEVDFLMVCREAGLELPQVNVLIEGRKVDFHWPRQRLVVETDGYTYHADRPTFERDHASTVELELAGYNVLRTTWEMLREDPQPFLHLVRARLAG